MQVIVCHTKGFQCLYTPQVLFAHCAYVNLLIQKSFDVIISSWFCLHADTLVT